MHLSVVSRMCLCLQCLNKKCKYYFNNLFVCVLFFVFVCNSKSYFQRFQFKYFYIFISFSTQTRKRKENIIKKRKKLNELSVYLFIFLCTHTYALVHVQRIRKDVTVTTKTFEIPISMHTATHNNRVIEDSFVSRVTNN